MLSCNKILTIAAIGFATTSLAQSISLQDIWLKGTYRTDYVYGLRSMNDGLHYTTYERTPAGPAIVKYAYATGQVVDTLVKQGNLAEPILFDDYAFSGDEKQILLKTETESIYRHSTREFNHIVDLSSYAITDVDTTTKQRYATFSPQGDQLAYVKNNNIYVFNIATQQETQITTDGAYNAIINGATDWVYEEEFAIAKAFFWSPNGKHIAFLKFDESEVVEFNMPLYGRGLYPMDYRFKYPKAGEDNSIVSLMVHSLETKKTTEIASTSDSETEYIPRVKWVSETQVAFQQFNRHQSALSIKLYNVDNQETSAIYTEQSDTYIDVVDGWQLVKNELMITSEKSGYNHIYAVNIQSGKVRPITQGEYDVTSFYGADQKYAYYQSAQESPMKRSIYRIDLKGKRATKLSEFSGWNDADFSTGMRYFINHYSSANSPGGYELRDAAGKRIRVLKDNARLNEVLNGIALAEKEFFTLPTEAGVELNAWMMKPTDFDASKNYPVLLTIYGGPGSQEVTDEWGGANFMWHQMLTQLGYIVVSVDNRGTGARGAAFKKQTYQNLGELELIDHLNTAKYLGNLAYVDAARIGIWGWSYGGYMSSLAATKGDSAFKAAIAVAPVTTWRYYDNIYTERYMRTPQENAAGYDDNSPVNFAQDLSANYLLIHGTADDNVHFQNAVQMVNALVAADKQFDSFYYPDRNHGIYGGNTRHHIFKLMTDWLQENL